MDRRSVLTGIGVVAATPAIAKQIFYKGQVVGIFILNNTLGLSSFLNSIRTSAEAISKHSNNLTPEQLASLRNIIDSEERTRPLIEDCFKIGNMLQ